MRRISVVVALLFLMLSPSVLRAQSTTGSISGRVTDPSHAVIADARVTAVNIGTNFRYEAATNSSGKYYLTNLPPGSYSLEVEKTGFKKLLRPDVTLHVQDALVIDFEYDARAEQGERHRRSGRAAGEYIGRDGQHVN